MTFSWKALRALSVATLTAALLGTCSLASAEVLEMGDFGEDITSIQTRLVALGFKLDADGEFGPATQQAIKRFQMIKGLEADGKVGPATYKLLMGQAMPQISRGGSMQARRVISIALKYLGVPYVFGGTSPYGFDCSGYIQYVFNQIGISLPRTADVQYEVGKAVPINKLQPGDLVFFETYEPGPSHVGIYLKNGDFVHASSNTGITVTSLYSSYYAPRFLGAKRIIR